MGAAHGVGRGHVSAESYLVIGRSGPLPAGVYHYDTAHHSLDRLSVGDQCDAIAAATGVRADLYAVSTLRFWKNTFKYHSFGYDVVTQDAGALLASWRLVLAAHHRPVEPVLWFDESAVGAVLDVDGCDEAPSSSFRSATRRSRRRRPRRARAPGSAGTPGTASGSSHAARTRSRWSAACTRPPWWSPAAAGPGTAQAGTAFAPLRGDVLTLPEPGPGPADLDLGESLRGRRSSFGLFTARPPLDVRDVGWVLSSVARAGLAGTDVAPAPRGHPWTRQWVLASSVAGLEQRVYGYDAARHSLVAGPALEVQPAAGPVRAGQLQHAGSGRDHRRHRPAGRSRGGVRRSRLPDAQHRGRKRRATAYLAATARGLGVGAVLGLDNIRIDELLGIAGTGERSMNFMLLGHERTPRLHYDHDLYRDRRGETGAAREGTVQ